MTARQWFDRKISIERLSDACPEALLLFTLSIHKETIMQKKSTFIRSLSFSFVLLEALAVAPKAQAVIANHSGAICKNYNAGEVTQIDYLVNGTRSYRTVATSVICPLTRNTSNSAGAWVYVDVTHTGSRTTTCTAYSYNYNGGFLASASQTWTGSGFHEFSLNLTGSGKSNSWSDYSVLCTIPGNSAGVVNGIDLSEY